MVSDLEQEDNTQVLAFLPRVSSPKLTENDQGDQMKNSDAEKVKSFYNVIIIIHYWYPCNDFSHLVYVLSWLNHVLWFLSYFYQDDVEMVSNIEQEDNAQVLAFPPRVSSPELTENAQKKQMKKKVKSLNTFCIVKIMIHYWFPCFNFFWSYLCFICIMFLAV